MPATWFAQKVAAESSAPGAKSGQTLRIRNIRTHDGLSRFAGDEKRYRHWLGDFIDSGPRTVVTISKAIDAGDIETAKRMVHSFRGRTSMLGMSELHALAMALEMTLHNREPSDYWLADFKTTILATCEDLRQALATPSD